MFTLSTLKKEGARVKTLAHAYLLSEKVSRDYIIEKEKYVIKIIPEAHDTQRHKQTMQIKTEKSAKSTQGTCNTLFTRHIY